MSNIDYLALTASGEDQVGLVERFTARILDAGCNIEESRMAVLGGQFSILMLVSGPWHALTKLEDSSVGASAVEPAVSGVAVPVVLFSNRSAPSMRSSMGFSCRICDIS